MDLKVYIRRGDTVSELASFEDKELFVSAFKEINSLRVNDGISDDADKVIFKFIDGVSFAKSDIKLLKRALRRFDEVYLCNELFDLIDGIEGDYFCISLNEQCSKNCFDFSAYKI